MKILDKTNTEISNIKSWREIFFVGSKTKHWKKHRSAMSTAEFWLDNQKILGLEKILKKSFPDLSLELAYPECELVFDKYSHPRENDILALDKNNKYLISVEAKTDESFGNCIFLDAMRKAIIEHRVHIMV